MHGSIVLEVRVRRGNAREAASLTQEPGRKPLGLWPHEFSARRGVDDAKAPCSDELADKSDDALWEMIRHFSNGKL